MVLFEGKTISEKTKNVLLKTGNLHDLLSSKNKEVLWPRLLVTILQIVTSSLQVLVLKDAGLYWRKIMAKMA